MSKYKWQGEPVKVEFGHCMVKTNKEKPLWWYNYECSQCYIFGYDGACLPALRITTKHNNQFVIANHYGIGIYKLTKGGWPNITHFSLPLDGFSTKSPQLKWSLFHLEAFEKHESDRRKWQKENYPEEFEKSERLRRMIIKSKER